MNIPTELKFNITDCKLYVLVVTLQEKYENILYENLQNGINIDFERKRYRTQIINQPATNNLNFLIDPTFNDVNRLFVLAFPNEEDRSSFSRYYMPNVLVDLQPFYDILIENKEETYKAITELINHDNYTVGNSFTYEYFSNHYKFIAIHLNDEHIEDSDNLDIIMNMYHLIKYSDNYSDSTASLYHFKRQKQSFDDNNPSDISTLTADNSTSFKYKSWLINVNSDAIAAGVNPNISLAHRLFRNVQITVPLKYVSSFFRSLESPLVNTKINFQLIYTKHSVILHGFNEPGDSQAANSSTLKITKTELYIPVVTLNTEDNNKLSQLLDTEFKRIIYWNEYKSKIETITQPHNDNNYKRTLLDIAIPGVNRLFVARFNDNDVLNVVPAGGGAHINNSARNKVERNNFTKHFLPRVDIKDYNVLIDGRNFFDQNVSDDFKKYEELRKVMTGRGEDYTASSLLDYDYWKRSYKLICCDLSKQKVLDSNPKANQQIEFVYKLDNTRAAPGTKAKILTVLEKEKKTNLAFSKGTVKFY